MALAPSTRKNIAPGLLWSTIEVASSVLAEDSHSVSWLTRVLIVAWKMNLSLSSEGGIAWRLLSAHTAVPGFASHARGQQTTAICPACKRQVASRQPPSRQRAKTILGDLLPPTNQTVLGEMLPPTNKTVLGEALPPTNRTVLGEACRRLEQDDPRGRHSSNKPNRSRRSSSVNQQDHHRRLAVDLTNHTVLGKALPSASRTVLGEALTPKNKTVLGEALPPTNRTVLGEALPTTNKTVLGQSLPAEDDAIVDIEILDTATNGNTTTPEPRAVQPPSPVLINTVAPSPGTGQASSPRAMDRSRYLRGLPDDRPWPFLVEGGPVGHGRAVDDDSKRSESPPLIRARQPPTFARGRDDEPPMNTRVVDTPHPTQRATQPTAVEEPQKPLSYWIAQLKEGEPKRARRSRPWSAWAIRRCQDFRTPGREEAPKSARERPSSWANRSRCTRRAAAPSRNPGRYRCQSARPSLPVLRARAWARPEKSTCRS